jgi:shikimate 5-dehydrogenase/3-dehydroquinate dehydratase
MIVLTVPNFSTKLKLKHRKEIFREYRLDLCDDWQDQDFQKLPKNTILTCRAESLSPELLQRMLDSSVLIDLDVQQLEQYPDVVPPERLILSLHLDEFDEDKIRSFLAHPQTARHYKLILNTEHFVDLLSTSQLIATQERKIIFNALGRWAYLQRALYTDFRSSGVYLAFGESIVKGQPEMTLIARIWSLMDIDDIGAFVFIGSEQVNTSATVWGYNELFSMQGDPCIMLPVPANDLDEALAVISFLRIAFSISGLVITSPFKKQMAEYLKSKYTIINTAQCLSFKHLLNSYHPELDLFVYTQNTDVIALRECLTDLKLKPNERIMIYGSGDTAEAFAQELLRLGYQHIALDGRNQERVHELRSTLGLMSCADEPYDLLINATPLGRDENDDISRIPSFRKLIDLPYLLEGVTLLSQLASNQNLPLISGIDFWKKQFSHQLHFLFYENPNFDYLEKNN